MGGRGGLGFGELGAAGVGAAEFAVHEKSLMFIIE